MFKEDDWTIVLQSGQHQAARIGRCGWNQYRQPWNVCQPAPQRLFVLPTVAVASATRGAHHNGRSPFATRKGFDLGSMVEQSIHAHS